MVTSVSVGTSARPQHGIARILVVEGPWRRGQLVSYSLRSEGFETAACDSGVQAKADFAPFQPELVIMAGELADIPAVALCAWIRARSAVPIVVVAQTNNFDAVRILDQGADLVLREPIGPSELLARVRAVLRRTLPRFRVGDTVVRFGDMKLDRGDRVLVLQGVSLLLDGPEFSLIETLMLSGGRVAPRSLLRGNLRVGNSELDGYVRRLRHRIEDVEGWRRIVSERAVGLRLLEQRPTRGAPMEVSGPVTG